MNTGTPPFPYLRVFHRSNRPKGLSTKKDGHPRCDLHKAHIQRHPIPDAIMRALLRIFVKKGNPALARIPFVYFDEAEGGTRTPRFYFPLLPLFRPQ